jgi:hypothetical protein
MSLHPALVIHINPSLKLLFWGDLLLLYLNNTVQNNSKKGNIIKIMCNYINARYTQRAFTSGPGLLAKLCKQILETFQQTCLKAEK